MSFSQTSSQAGLGSLPLELIHQIAFFLGPAEQKPAPPDVSSTYHVESSSGQVVYQQLRSEPDHEKLRKQVVREDTRNLKNLAISCKSFYAILKQTLYQSSEQDDWYALRWGCFHGSIQTMDNAVTVGAPLDYAYANYLNHYHAESHCRCGVWDNNQDTICALIHEKKPVRSAETPLLTAIRGGQVEAVDWLLSKGASATWATPSLVPSELPQGYWVPRSGGRARRGVFCGTCGQLYNPNGPRPGSCRGNCGITPLQGALDYFTHSSFSGSLLETDENRVSVLKSLINHGADINKGFDYTNLDHPGYLFHHLSRIDFSPLHLALCTRTVGPGTIQFLLDQGAIPESRASLIDIALPRRRDVRHVQYYSWRIGARVDVHECESKISIIRQVFPSFFSKPEMPMDTNVPAFADVIEHYILEGTDLAQDIEDNEY